MGWAWSRLIVQPVKWTLGLDQSADLTSQKQDLLFIDLADELGESIMNQVRSNAHYRTDYVMDDESLLYQLNASIFLNQPLGHKDYYLVLEYLYSKQRIGMSRVNGKVVLKFTQNQINVDAFDLNIVDVKMALFKLQRRIDGLEERIQLAVNGARQAVSKDKAKAMYHIKLKKRLEENVKPLYDSLHNLEGILQRIQQAQTNEEVILAYQSGVKGLNESISAKGLSQENVENTLDQLADILADHQDIEEAIAQGQQGIITSVDEDELEKELDQLLENHEDPRLKVMDTLPLANHALPEPIEKIQVRNETKIALAS